MTQLNDSAESLSSPIGTSPFDKQLANRMRVNGDFIRTINKDAKSQDFGRVTACQAVALFPLLAITPALLSCLPVPPIPTGLDASPGATEVILTWTESPGATYYNIKRATVHGGPYRTIATGIPVPTYEDAAITPGTTYYYVVSAVNSGGESANSAEKSATPSNCHADILGDCFSGCSGTLTPLAVGPVCGWEYDLGDGGVGGSITLSDGSAVFNSSGDSSNPVMKKALPVPLSSLLDATLQ